MQEEQKEEGVSFAQAVFGKLHLCHQEGMVYRHVVTNLIVQEGETTAMNETSLASLWS